MGKSENEIIVRKDDVFIIPEGEVFQGNIVVLGGVVSVKGTLKGNIVSLRGKVKVNAHVEGSLVAIYSKIVLAGAVSKVMVLYSEMVVDGGYYKDMYVFFSYGDILRLPKVKRLIVKKDPISSLLFGILFGYIFSSL